MKTPGFFHVEQTADGRWWAVNPDGEKTIIRGVDWVIYTGHRCEADAVNHYKEWNDAHYASRTDWEAETLARLKAWGFNMLGTGADATLRHRGLVHAWEINFGNKFGTPDDWTDERWICPNERRPCSALPNVFHPDFPAHCAKIARDVCAPMKDDRDLLGYFLDNELRWWGTGDWAGFAGVYDEVAKKPEGHSARVALDKFAAENPSLAGDDLKKAFLALVAERYFQIAVAAIKAEDPNHMILGCRFAGLGGAHETVWAVAGKYSDIVTFNCYPEADLARNVMKLGSAKLADEFGKRYEIVGRPMLVTEWSFPALDSGLPCTNGAGQRFLTQKERTAATELCAKTFLSLPFLVGYDYFMWVDEPANGISSAFPENTNYGLVSEKGVPYPELTGMFERLHAEVGKWHDAATPPERLPAPEYASWRPEGNWYGVNLLGLFRAPWNSSDARCCGRFPEEHFRWLGDWGFNFARLPMDYRNFVAKGNWHELREEGFAKVDEAVEFGRKYGIHVQISLHRAPGFTIFPNGDLEPANLATDAEPQKAFRDLWRAFARRYRGIPNERLSFNPVNEPCGFSTEQFARVFGDMLIAVREEDPGRFVMFDGNGVASQPVWLFTNFRSTGQAFRGYTPHAISHYGAWYIQDQPLREPEWPIDPSIIDKRWIFEMPETTFGKYEALANSGYPVMVGEFGCFNKISHETALAWMEHCLKLWSDHNLGWALWNLDGAFGFIDSGREDVDYEDFEGHKLDRKMLDLLRRYARRAEDKSR